MPEFAKNMYLKPNWPIVRRNLERTIVEHLLKLHNISPEEVNTPRKRTEVYSRFIADDPSILAGIISAAAGVPGLGEIATSVGSSLWDYASGYVSSWFSPNSGDSTSHPTQTLQASNQAL
jgi:hypothetical protein